MAECKLDCVLSKIPGTYILHITHVSEPFTFLTRYHYLLCLVYPLRGGAPSGAAVASPQGQDEKKRGRKEGHCLVSSVSCCCCSSLSLPTTQVSQPTPLNHPWKTHMWAFAGTHTHTSILLHTPRNDSRLPPSFPPREVTQGERRKKSTKGQNTTWWSEERMESGSEAMSSLAFSALRRQQVLCATELLLNMSFMMHNARLSHHSNCSAELNRIVVHKWHSSLFQWIQDPSLPSYALHC